MTKKHKIYFLLWKIYARLLGFYSGVFIEVWSVDKKKWIKSVITQADGVSITNSRFAFDFNVHHFEPVQGNDSRFFSRGSFTLDDLRKIKKGNYRNWLVLEAKHKLETI